MCRSFFSVLVWAVLCCSNVDGRPDVKFGNLCNGNTNIIRGCDSHGCGNYGARRGSGTHMGVDIVCYDGSSVLAPFDVQLTRQSVPYTAQKIQEKPSRVYINDGVQMEGQGLCFKLFYVRPDRYSGMVRKGQRIGTLLPMQRVYPGITSHIHVQMCNTQDPTRYF